MNKFHSLLILNWFCPVCSLHIFFSRKFGAYILEKKIGGGGWGGGRGGLDGCKQTVPWHKNCYASPKGYTYGNTAISNTASEHTRWSSIIQINGNDDEEERDKVQDVEAEAKHDDGESGADDHGTGNDEQSHQVTAVLEHHRHPQSIECLHAQC